MKNKRIFSGFTLVEIMIVVALLALLAAVGIPGLLRAKKTANEASTRATVKTIAAALEMYAAYNEGAYPTDENLLVNPAAGPPYLSRAYHGVTINTYSYNCANLTSAGYMILAGPTRAGEEGICFNMSTGANLTELACSPAE